MGNLGKVFRACMRSRLLALATAIAFATVLVGQPAIADPGLPVDTTVVASENPTDSAVLIPGVPATTPAAEVPPETLPTTEPTLPPASDAPGSPTPTDASLGQTSPAVTSEPATGVVPPAQAPSTPENNPSNAAVEPVVPVGGVPAPEQALRTVVPLDQLPLDFATANALPDNAASSETAIVVTSPEETPRKSAGVAVKSKKNNTDALVAFQLNPNMGTATQLVAATGSSPLVQGITLVILLGLGFAYFRFMRPNGKHGHTSAGSAKA